MITLNLLPPQEKKIIALEKIQERVIQNSLIVFIICWLLIFVLLIILFINLYQANLIQKSLQVARVALSLNDSKELSGEIKEINKQLEVLEAVQSNYQYPSLLLEQITQIIPTGARLNNLSMRENKIILEGWAAQRKQVLALKEALEKSDNWQNIESPVSNFLKPTDINFYFSFNLSI